MLPNYDKEIVSLNPKPETPTQNGPLAGCSFSSLALARKTSTSGSRACAALVGFKFRAHKVYIRLGIQV